MKREEVEPFLKCKKVFVTTAFSNSSIYYTGKIIEVTENSMTMIDKFGNLVVISLDSIKKIEEQKGD